MLKNTEKIPDLLLYGTGGHATVVRAAAHAIGYQSIHFFDDNISEYLNLIGAYDENIFSEIPVHIAVGDAVSRERIFNAVQHKKITLVHPKAYVENDISLGEGCFVGVFSVVNSRSIIEKGLILNTSAVIEHDCRVGAFTHIAPGTVICGNVFIGSRCLIGAGSVIKNNLKIGNDVIIGAGSVVIRDLPDGVTAVGNPAKIIKTEKRI